MNRTRLAGLGGIRGLAGLFVVVNHVVLRASPGYRVAVARLIVPQPGHGLPDGESVLVDGLLAQNIGSGRVSQGVPG